MKTIKQLTLLASVCIAVLLTAGCRDGQVSGEDVKLKPCKHSTQYLRELGEMEVRLFKKRPDGDIQTWPHGYQYLSLGDETLWIDSSSLTPPPWWDEELLGSWDDPLNRYRSHSTYEICNFPAKRIKHWTIPDEGITVVIDGKVFTAGSFHPADADRMFYELELTTFRLK